MKSLIVFVILAIGLSGARIAGGQTPGSSGATDGSAVQQSMRLLVLFPAGVARPSDAVLQKSLKKLPRKGWLVSVERPDGTLTCFVSRDALAAALTQTGSGQDSQAQISESVNELLHDSQNSVVLFASKVQPTFQRPEWTYPLVRKRVPIYVVDGGESRRVTYDQSWGYTRSGGMWSYDTVIRQTRYITGEILHEVNLKGAIRDIRKDRKNGYKSLNGRSN